MKRRLFVVLLYTAIIVGIFVGCGLWADTWVWEDPANDTPWGWAVLMSVGFYAVIFVFVIVSCVAFDWEPLMDLWDWATDEYKNRHEEKPPKKKYRIVEIYVGEFLKYQCEHWERSWQSIGDAMDTLLEAQEYIDKHKNREQRRRYYKVVAEL